MNLPNEPDFMADVFDLIKYVTGLDGSKIFRGNQSREVLPESGDFCIFTPISRTRVGTNVTAFDAKDIPDSQNGIETDSALVRIDIQLDFYGDNAMRMAQGIEVFAVSLRCNQRLWHLKSKTRVLYASNPYDATIVDETRQYIPRWITTLSICITTSVEDGQPWFQDLHLHGTKLKDDYDPESGPPTEDDYTPASQAGLVNVDVYFDPNEKE